MDQKLRKNIFYGILLLCVALLIYQPTHVYSAFSDRLLVTRWEFVWSHRTTSFTAWGTLVTIELALVALAFIFLGITKKN